LVVPPGEWGKWVNGGGWLVIDGYHVDLILRDAERVKNVISEWRKGIEKYKRFLLKYEFTPEQKVFYRKIGAPLEATLSQNMVIKTKILECVVAHFKTKYKISKMWVKSRID